MITIRLCNRSRSCLVLSAVISWGTMAQMVYKSTYLDAMICLWLLLASPGLSAEAVKPLSLHPDNPHYFLFRGKPAVLITSGEHYGAVLNLDFDYTAYFEELAAHRFNHT